jgi:hypothetical protein
MLRNVKAKNEKNKHESSREFHTRRTGLDNLSFDIILRSFFLPPSRENDADD